MPELPEVEVVRRSLKKFIIGKKIRKVDILNSNLRYKIDQSLKIITKKQRVISVKRRSKYLLIYLSNNHTILLHLGMTGKIFVSNKNKIFKTSFYFNKIFDRKHNHFIIKFSESSAITYNDVRKFGFVKIFKSKEINNCSHLKYLGPDPLGKDFSENYLKKKLPKIKKNIKNFLMDQKYISGVGNIYANEILNLSSINPRKKVYNLNAKNIRKLIKKTKQVLKQAIKYGGSSIKDFKGISGRKGLFQQKFRVYDRESLKCKKIHCKGIIKKIYISRRSSFYCPVCQNN